MFSHSKETVNAYPPFFQHQNQFCLCENIPTQIIDHQQYLFQRNNVDFSMQRNEIKEKENEKQMEEMSEEDVTWALDEIN